MHSAIFKSTFRTEVQFLKVHLEQNNGAYSTGSKFIKTNEIFFKFSLLIGKARLLPQEFVSTTMEQLMTYT